MAKTLGSSIELSQKLCEVIIDHQNCAIRSPMNLRSPISMIRAIIKKNGRNMA